MTAPTATNLFPIDDLDDSSMTGQLTSGNLRALQTTANWIKTFVARPNKDLGRAGSVCPFVPGGMQRRTVWLAPEQIAEAGVTDVIGLISGYKNLLLRAQPIEGEDADYKAIVVVFTDISADRANDLMGDAEAQDFKRLSYVDDGVVMGDFHQRNDGTAIYNSSFHPFRAPVPFFLMRRAVVSDWKFFLDNDEWFGYWARRFGDAAVQALAEELRRTNWRLLESDASS